MKKNQQSFNSTNSITFVRQCEGTKLVVESEIIDGKEPTMKITFEDRILNTFCPSIIWGDLNKMLEFAFDIIATQHKKEPFNLNL